MDNLDRFRQAQDAPHAGYAAALRELQAGEKTGHWIWYVFPQLAGLGQSSTAVYYGLDSVEEAAAYLRDPVLGARLVGAATAARAHLAGGGARPIRLLALMGSEIDARKLVSSMTLFGHVARTDSQPHGAAMAAHADAILAAAAAQGYDRCAYTADRLG